jgi:hypothetical protein
MAGVSKKSGNGLTRRGTAQENGKEETNSLRDEIFKTRIRAVTRDMLTR